MKIWPLLLLLAALSLGALVQTGPTASTRSFDEIERTGSLVTLRLEDDGTVYLLLRTEPRASESEDDTPDMSEIWFRSPADRSVEVDLASMILDLALAARDGGLLTIRAEASRTDDGSTIEAASQILSISLNN